MENLIKNQISSKKLFQSTNQEKERAQREMREKTEVEKRRQSVNNWNGQLKEFAKPTNRSIKRRDDEKSK